MLEHVYSAMGVSGLLAPSDKTIARRPVSAEES